MSAETETSKNGSNHTATPAIPQTPAIPPIEQSIDETVDGYTIRDLIFFPNLVVEAGGGRQTITITPKERVLLGRIFFHKTLAENVALERFAVGERTIARGAGSAEVFLATIPNWTPQKIFLDKDNPLILVVHNGRNFPLRTTGSVVVFKKS